LSSVSAQRPVRDRLAGGIDALGLHADDETLGRLLDYADLISRWNKVYNLTAITSPDQIVVQHLLDSLAVLPALDRWFDDEEIDGPQVADIGSGAGLPGVVLAMMRPAWQVTCVDAVAKKATFIRQVGAELRLGNLTAAHARVQDMAAGGQHLVTSRAFASLSDFTRWSSHLLRPGGVWVAMKAHVDDEERHALGGGVEVFHVEPLTVPGLEARRQLIWMRPVNGAPEAL